MIGLVLWSDAGDSKAVFWCEDHGDLAYFDANMDPRTAGVSLSAGDMVEFDVTVENSIRHAHHPYVVTPKVSNVIQDNLLETAARSATPIADDASNVVPFKRAANSL